MRKSSLAWISLAVVALVVLVISGYQYAWTGFGERPTPQGQMAPARTLWDWLELLIVPAVLAVGAYLLDSSRKRSEGRVEADRQRQHVLEEYFGYISELILEKHLYSEETAGVARELARTRTLTALRLLDGKRKAQLLQFLYEARLIGKDPIVELNGADLTNAILDEAKLSGVEIRGAYFSGASIRDAHLIGADLRGSDFSGVDFSHTDLTQAKLNQAILDRAVFHGVLTNETDLSDVDLAKLALSEEQRRQVIT